MKEVVKFSINTPVEVTLQYQTGKHVEGRYGGQVMYSLLDGRVMYVPPYVEQRLQELAIGAGEPLILCRREVTAGDRHKIEWSVRRAPQPPQTLESVLAAAEPATEATTPMEQRVLNRFGDCGGEPCCRLRRGADFVERWFQVWPGRGEHVWEGSSEIGGRLLVTARVRPEYRGASN